MRGAVMLIWVGAEFKPAEVRLIKVDNVVLIRMGGVGELRLIANSESFYFQAGQGAWQAIVRNSKNRWALPHFPTARGRTKLGWYFAEIKIAKLKF